jgi:hypothetical protein
LTAELTSASKFGRHLKEMPADEDQLRLISLTVGVFLLRTWEQNSGNVWGFVFFGGRCLVKDDRVKCYGSDSSSSSSNSSSSIVGVVTVVLVAVMVMVLVYTITSILAWLHVSISSYTITSPTFICKSFFYPMPHVLYGLRSLPPGCGWSVTDFWGWDAHEARLRCPDEVDGDIWIWSTRRVLKPKFY